MATKQSISSQLIRGAYTSARSGGYQKSNFKLDFSDAAKILQNKAAANQKLQEEAEEMLNFQPALGKVGQQDQGPLLDYFSGIKNQMADIHTQMQGADRETKIRLSGELARLKQTAVTANESLTQRSQISEDYANSVQNQELTNSMDPIRRAQLDKIHIEKDYELILQNGQTAYKLPDGSILTNKEANDFKLKAYDQQSAITKLSDKYFNSGLQNKTLPPDTSNSTIQSLMKGLSKDAIESLKSDKLLGDQDLIIDEKEEIDAINSKYGTNYKLGDELSEEHEKYGVANNIVGHLQNVYNQGKQQYTNKLNQNKKPGNNFTTSVSQEITAYERPLYMSAYNTSKGNVAGGVGFDKNIALSNINKELRSNDPNHLNLLTSTSPEAKKALARDKEKGLRPKDQSLDENRLYVIDEKGELRDANAPVPNFENHKEVYFFMIDQNMDMDATTKRILKNRYVEPKPTKRQKSLKRIRQEII